MFFRMDFDEYRMLAREKNVSYIYIYYNKNKIFNMLC